jgi:hypothetical protein
MRKRSLQPTRVTPDPRPRQKQQNRWSGVPIIQTRLRKVPPEREREEAAVPEAIERLISRGPPAPGAESRSRLGAVGITMASLPVRPRSFGIPVPTIAAGWALIAASCARSA